MVSHWRQNETDFLKKCLQRKVPINLLSDVRSRANMQRMLVWKKTFPWAKLFFNPETKPVSWKAEVLARRLSQLWWACVSSSDKRELGLLAQQWTYHTIKHWTVSQEYLHFQVRMFFPFPKMRHQPFHKGDVTLLNLSQLHKLRNLHMEPFKGSFWTWK